MTKRILVIEDNSDIAANIGDYLEEKGHVVDFAGSQKHFVLRLGIVRKATRTTFGRLQGHILNDISVLGDQRHIQAVDGRNVHVETSVYETQKNVPSLC